MTIRYSCHLLTLIAAPAGFGKTILLAEWHASRSSELRVKSSELASPATIFNSQLLTLNFSVAWVSLDADDNDPTRFWTYVIAALKTVYPTMDTAVEALLRSPQPPMDAVVTSLINAITPTDIEAALILDDYHLIDTPAIHTAVTFLLDHLPPRLHLVLISRADPPLPLTRLRSRGELTEVRGADLRFTADEAAAFLTTMMGLPLSGDELAALHQRASAWYEQAGLVGEAVRYAFLVRDVERSAALIERHALALILASSDVLLVQSWLDQVPRAGPGPAPAGADRRLHPGAHRPVRRRRTPAGGRGASIQYARSAARRRSAPPAVCDRS